jgi:hypothetical protein
MSGMDTEVQISLIRELGRFLRYLVFGRHGASPSDR